MITFGVKQIGFSSDINDPLTLKPIVIPKGEWWSVSIPKSSLPTCKLRVSLIKNYTTSGTCKCEDDNQVISTSCLYELPNDNRAYLNLTILNKDVIPAFNIVVDETEILEFEGGDISELILLINGMGLGLDELGYGIRIFFDREYNGKVASISSTEQGLKEVYLLSETFCLNYSQYIGVSFSFCETGCYRLGFVNKDGDILAISNQFNVFNKAPKCDRIVEYYLHGYYHRHRMTLKLRTPRYVNEEEQKILSTGDISILNVIIRTQAEFYTGLLSHDEHIRLLSVFKKEFKVDGKKVIMVGGYNNDTEGFGQMSIGSGTLNYVEDVYKNIDACAGGCETGSVFRFEIYETEKAQNILS